MTALLLLAATGLSEAGYSPPGQPPDWKFVDESTRAGRSVLTFRTVDLADNPTRPLHAADKPPGGSKFGSVGLGPGGRKRLAVMWHTTTGALWFDADGDGRFAPTERYILADKPVEAKVSVPFDEKVSHERTVLLRKRADGMAWAVRGYTSGSIVIGGKSVAAVLTDGDADGCFDGAGADRVWLDTDGDGAFDPLSEQFPLGNAITVGGGAVLVNPRPDGLAVAARERPSEAGKLQVEVARLPGAEVVEFSASYVSEFGELIVVKDVNKAVSLPAGKYRVDSVRLKLAAADGKVWHYSFASGDRKPALEVVKGKETVHDPLGGLKVTVGFDARGVTPGTAVQVLPDVVAGSLYLTRCEVGEKFADYGREVAAEIKLTEPGSVVLDRCESGFH
jgi:hypothetical protein